jgi:hypothetical protein
MWEMEHFEKREGTNRGKDSEGEGLKGQSVMVQGTLRLACSLDILRKHPRAQSTLYTRHSRMSLSSRRPAEASSLSNQCGAAARILFNSISCLPCHAHQRKAQGYSGDLQGGKAKVTRVRSGKGRRSATRDRRRLHTADPNAGSAVACSAPAPGKPCGRTRFCALLVSSLTHMLICWNVKNTCCFAGRILFGHMFHSVENST